MHQVRKLRQYLLRGYEFSSLGVLIKLCLHSWLWNTLLKFSLKILEFKVAVGEAICKGSSCNHDKIVTSMTKMITLKKLLRLMLCSEHVWIWRENEGTHCEQVGPLIHVIELVRPLLLRQKRSFPVPPSESILLIPSPGTPQLFQDVEHEPVSKSHNLL